MNEVVRVGPWSQRPGSSEEEEGTPRWLTALGGLGKTAPSAGQAGVTRTNPGGPLVPWPGPLCTVGHHMEVSTSALRHCEAGGSLKGQQRPRGAPATALPHGERGLQLLAAWHTQAHTHMCTHRRAHMHRHPHMHTHTHTEAHGHRRHAARLSLLTLPQMAGRHQNRGGQPGAGSALKEVVHEKVIAG